MARRTWHDLPATDTPLSASFINDLEARKPEVDYQALNVRDFPGASPGAQLTNALAAVSALPGTGATLFIPRGYYVGAFSLTSEDHVTILGEGSSTVLHNTTGSANALTLTDCNELEIHGIRVQGTSGTQDGLSLIRCHRARIGNVFCSGTGRHGIRCEECIGLTVDPCYCGSALTAGPYPANVVALQSCLVLTWDGVNADSGCNGFQINGGFYISGQSQSWAIQIDHAELGVINGPIPELSGGGIYAQLCEHLTINGFYGEANPSDIEYAVGTASVTNGSTAVTGAGTAWATNDGEGHPNAWLNKYLFVGSSFQRILTAPTNTSVTLSANWPGTTLATQPYWIRSIDLLLESCKDTCVHGARVGTGLVLDGSIRSDIKGVVDYVVLNATSNDNVLDVASNRGGWGATTRIVDAGARNMIRESNWQTNTIRRQGIVYADRLRAGDTTPSFVVDSALEIAGFGAGYAMSVSQGSTGWPFFLMETGGWVQLGSGGGSAPDTTVGRSKAATFSVIVGDLAVDTAGKGLQIKEGSNAKMGTATLVAGTVTVATTAVTANSRIFYCVNVAGGTQGFLRVSARTAGTSFVITSTQATETSTLVWMLVEPA